MTKQIKDKRPRAAIAHVLLGVRDVPSAITFFSEIGLRPIVTRQNFAVMELRGGTHLVLQASRRKVRRGKAAPFDLMFDDVAAMRRRCVKLGFKPSSLQRGRIHDAFTLTGPGGYRFTIFSSHASNHPV